MSFRYKGGKYCLKDMALLEKNIWTKPGFIEFFGSFTASEIEQRYLQNRFVPCKYSDWQLNKESYRAAVKKEVNV